MLLARPTSNMNMSPSPSESARVSRKPFSRKLPTNQLSQSVSQSVSRNARISTFFARRITFILNTFHGSKYTAIENKHSRIQLCYPFSAVLFHCLTVTASFRGQIRGLRTSPRAILINPYWV